ncbi:MAG TPA: hypothetical protein VJ939_00765 [Bacteroidales bacterium]|nr:hypothetical protein [Bacteroidales bacterium]HKK77711.1 hypothetical protein [Saprospiraceae bacterium]
MIDEAFLKLSDFIQELSEHESKVEGGDYGFNMEVEEIKLGMPIQLDIVVEEDGKIALGGVPPLYYVETSVMPVFHSIKLSLGKDK